MIEYVPLGRFSAYHKEGWKLVPGYDLRAGDYAALMQSPGHNIGLSNKEAGRQSYIDGKRKAELAGEYADTANS